MKSYFNGSIPIILSFLLFFLSINTSAQEYVMKKGVIYIIRHAEKDAGEDPRLNPQGYARSGDLERALKNKLDRIYINQYRRTQLTADSVRLKQKADTVYYVADSNGDGLMKALLKYKNKDKKILIIGHSNTIPVILRRLGITDYPAGNIPDNEYDNLFTVTFHKGKAFLFKSKFGKPSVPSNNVGSMKLQ